MANRNVASPSRGRASSSSANSPVTTAKHDRRLAADHLDVAVRVGVAGRSRVQVPGRSSCCSVRRRGGRCGHRRRCLAVHRRGFLPERACRAAGAGRSPGPAAGAAMNSTMRDCTTRTISIGMPSAACIDGAAGLERAEQQAREEHADGLRAARAARP